MSHHPYAGEAYVSTLLKDGRSVFVEPWKVHVLARPIRNSLRMDAMGAYPMLPLSADSDLPAGIDALRAMGLVSIVFVPDPLLLEDIGALNAVVEHCRPYKQHYVIDRSLGALVLGKHHRYEVRRALRSCRITAGPLADYRDRWRELYAALVQSHGIVGVADFSVAYFDMLERLPGLTAFVATVEDRIEAMSLWIRHGDIVYNHLGASSKVGYRHSASYALYNAAIEHYSECRFMNLGGAADSGSAGLAYFKKGFSNSVVTAHLCGAILDRTAYNELCSVGGGSEWFPAYRGGQSG